jgi:hypothetical protein
MKLAGCVRHTSVMKWTNIEKTQLETQVELEMCLYHMNRASNETS